MSSQWTVSDFLDRIFNFLTLAKGYRLAAL